MKLTKEKNTMMAWSLLMWRPVKHCTVCKEENNQGTYNYGISLTMAQDPNYVEL